MIISIASLIFFAVVCLIFFNIRQTLRTRFLVVSGLVYAFLLSPYAGAVVLIVSVLTWLMGMLIGRLHAEDHPHTAAVMTGGSAAAAVLLLLAFKFVHPLQTAGILPGEPPSLLRSQLKRHLLRGASCYLQGREPPRLPAIRAASFPPRT